MNITSIENEEQYNEALGEIKNLIGAPVGTPEAERLDRLLALITAYEENNNNKA